MKVILKTRVKGIGNEWDTVTVKDGYARNFLLPNNLAQPASPTLLAQAEKFRADRIKKAEELTENAKEMAKKLSKAVITLSKKAKAEKLYGSITEKEIIDALKKEHKVEVSKEMVMIKDHIKTIGEHKIKLQLAEKVEAEIIVKVEEEK